MLDAWIIEKIRRREEEERRRYEQPMLEIPEDEGYGKPEPTDGNPKREDIERGVIIIDFSV